MTQRIKLIWDFRGPDAKEIAEHHAIHLQEFAIREKLSRKEIDCEFGNDSHWMACMTVSEEEMIKVRDALRPHRGVLA